MVMLVTDAIKVNVHLFLKQQMSNFRTGCEVRDLIRVEQILCEYGMHHQHAFIAILGSK